MSESSLESYKKIAAVDAVYGASSSEAVSLDASENCKICCAALCVCVWWWSVTVCAANVGLV